MDDFVIAFIELQGWGGLTYRFEATNFHEQERCRVRSRYIGGTIATGSFHEQERCRVRSRYIGGTIATGSFNEIENSCSQAGEKYAIKVRGTF